MTEAMERKGKGLRRIIHCMVFISTMLVMLAGCGKGKTDQGFENEDKGNQTMGETTTENSIIQECSDLGEADGEQAVSGELVTTEGFMSYYQMAENDVPSDYLAEFIRHRQLTEASLGDLSYDKMVKKLYERGVTFGTRIVDLLSGTQVQLLPEDDFLDVAYIVMMKDLYEAGTDMCTPQNIILEVDNQRVYITQKNVTDDYTEEENVRFLSKQEVAECLQKLRSIITEDWNTVHMAEKKTYIWKLNIIKEDGSIISYQGEGVDETFHPGLEQWCEQFFE